MEAEDPQHEKGRLYCAAADRRSSSDHISAGG
jgi:hypothetical protein